MIYNIPSTSPEQMKFKWIKLMRVALLIFLIGNSIQILSSVISYLISILYTFYGDYYFYIYYDIIRDLIPLSSLFAILSILAMLPAYILMLIALFKIGETGSPNLKQKCMITFTLIIVSRIIGFIFWFVFSAFPYMSSTNYEITIAVQGVILVGLNSTSYIFMGIAFKQLKTEHRLGTQYLITPFVYLLVIGFRLYSICSTSLPEMTNLIVGMIGSIAQGVILIFFSIEMSSNLKRVQDLIHTNLPRITPIPTFSPQPSVNQNVVGPSRRGDKFCVNCGNPLVDEARFCGNCGHPIERS